MASGVKFDPVLGELRQDDSGSGTGSGDMTKAVYDPANVNGQLVGTGDARLSDSRPASDVSAWAKAGTKPSYIYTEVGAEQSGAVATHSALTTGVHGAGANNFIYSNDSRLTNSRTPVPAGSDKQIQFNDGGTTQNGVADLTFDKTAKLLYTSGDFKIDGFIVDEVNETIASDYSLLTGYVYTQYDTLTISGTSLLTIPGTAILKIV